MNYISTRDSDPVCGNVTSAYAIKNGIAENGGLYMPSSIPRLSDAEMTAMINMDYPHVCAEILSRFLTDYTYDEILSDALSAYSPAAFPDGPVGMKNCNGIDFLELWHGPTCAFKDMALQLMPKLMTRALKKTQEDRTACILVATSGDTGKAALEGFKNAEGIKIHVFFPEGGVSRIQELQMRTQDGNNVKVTSVNGNFDDAQTEVKRIFVDREFCDSLSKKGYFLSSANSINFARLAPQIVYHAYGYLTMVREGRIKFGDRVNVCVPTGNFGNILSAYIAKLMGIPFGRFICASNENNVLTDFFNDGIYDKNRRFLLTLSPSMDILVSSNLERLLWLVSDTARTTLWMKQLRETGRYAADEETKRKLGTEFCGYYADDSMTIDTISRYYRDHGYLIDTHTAVAANCAEQYIKKTGDRTPILLASTASPYKFSSAVYKAVSGTECNDSVRSISLLSDYTGTPVPAPIASVLRKEIRFSDNRDPGDLRKSISDFLV